MLKDFCIRNLKLVLFQDQTLSMYRRIMKLCKQPTVRLLFYLIFSLIVVCATIKFYPTPLYQENVEEDNYSWSELPDNLEEPENRQDVTSKNRSQKSVSENLQFLEQATKFLMRAGDVLLSIEEVKLMLTLLREFDRISRLRRFKYMLYGGTLLGAYRHSGFIEYYDTLKVFINVKYKYALQKALLGSNITVFQEDNKDVKLFLPSAVTRLSHASYRYPWPHIQLCFFRAEGTIVKDLRWKIDFKANKIFPLINLPFEGLFLPAPRCPEHVLSTYLTGNFIKQCCTGQLDNKRGMSRIERAECIECAFLHDILSFTSWRRINRTHAREVVSPIRLGKTALRIFEMTLPMPDCEKL